MFIQWGVEDEHSLQITQSIGELIEKELLKNELLWHDKQTHKLAVELAAEAGLGVEITQYQQAYHRPSYDGSYVA